MRDTIWSLGQRSTL